MTLEPTSTTRLIQQGLDQLRDGGADRQAIVGRIVTHAYARLENLSHRMLKSFSRLPEETGDVMSAAYQRLARALSDEQVLARLTTVQDFLNLAAAQIRRELIDLSRRYARRMNFVGPGKAGSGLSSSILSMDPGDQTFAPEQLALWTEFHEQVELLPDDERHVFSHVWYYELSYVETAQLLGVVERTVRRRFLSARLMLSDQLGGRLPF